MTDPQIHAALRSANGIRTGSVVRLKSGGPTMTVSEIKEGGVLNPALTIARCHWIDDNGGGREYTFPVVALIPY